MIRSNLRIRYKLPSYFTSANHLSIVYETQSGSGDRSDWHPQQSFKVSVGRHFVGESACHIRESNFVIGDILRVKLLESPSENVKKGEKF